MGKSSFALNVAENVSKVGGCVLFCSLEVGAIELADKLLCSVAKVNGHRLRSGTPSTDDRQRIVASASAISQWPLYTDDSASRTVSQIAASARRVARRSKTGLQLLVIDYLQLIEPDSSKDPRQEQVAKMSRRLKGLARELKIPVVCLAQLNRQAEDRADHRPRLSMLRESGAVEQDADVVMFVHREEYYLSDAAAEKVRGEAEIIIAKQRHGPTDTAKMVWRKEYTRFEDKAPDRFNEFDTFNRTGQHEEAF